MTWLAGVVPYAQAAEVFERIGPVPVPATSIWEQAQATGKRWQAHQTKHQAHVSVERTVLPPAGQDQAEPKGLSLDGGTVHIRQEGWKEFKVGTVYDVTPVMDTDPVTQDPVEVARGEHLGYCAVLGTVEQFAPALWALAVERHLPTAAEVAITADGAEWIWNLANDYFPDSIQIVDWYHATHHVAQAAAALHPQQETAAHTWADDRSALLSHPSPAHALPRVSRTRVSHWLRHRRERHQTIQAPPDRRGHALVAPRR